MSRIIIPALKVLTAYLKLRISDFLDFMFSEILVINNPVKCPALTQNFYCKGTVDSYGMLRILVANQGKIHLKNVA